MFFFFSFSFGESNNHQLLLFDFSLVSVFVVVVFRFASAAVSIPSCRGQQRHFRWIENCHIGLFLSSICTECDFIVVSITFAVVLVVQHTFGCFSTMRLFVRRRGRNTKKPIGHDSVLLLYKCVWWILCYDFESDFRREPALSALDCQRQRRLPTRPQFQKPQSAQPATMCCSPSAPHNAR